MMARRMDPGAVPPVARLCRRHGGDDCAGVVTAPLSPSWRGEGRGGGSRAGDALPLTLALSPQGRGEGAQVAAPLRHRRRAGADRPQRAGAAAGDLARRARRDRPLGAAEAADRRACGSACRRGSPRPRSPTWRASRSTTSRRSGTALAPPYEPLFAWLEGRAPRPDVADAPVFRPLMLSHPLEDSDWAALDSRSSPPNGNGTASACSSWRRRGEARLYSRTGDDIGQAFPTWSAGCDFDAVLDGELLVRAATARSAPFNDLQQRLNRKAVTQEAARAVPGACAALRCADARGRGSARAAVRRAPRAARSLVWQACARRAPTCRR